MPLTTRLPPSLGEALLTLDPARFPQFCLHNSVGGVLCSVMLFGAKFPRGREGSFKRPGSPRRLGACLPTERVGRRRWKLSANMSRPNGSRLPSPKGDGRAFPWVCRNGAEVPHLGAHMGRPLGTATERTANRNTTTTQHTGPGHGSRHGRQTRSSVPFCSTSSPPRKPQCSFVVHWVIEKEPSKDKTSHNAISLPGSSGGGSRPQTSCCPT